VNLTIDEEKKSEILKHLMKADKVKMNWLATICMVRLGELEEIANEYVLEIDDQGNIHAPKKEAIIKEMMDYIKKSDEAESISSILQPSILETEFSPEVIDIVESIFEKEGFDFKIYQYTIHIDETGITIKKKKDLLSKLPWQWIKSIRSTRLKKDSFIFEEKKGVISSIYPRSHIYDKPSDLLIEWLDVKWTKPKLEKMETISQNVLILSLVDGNYKQINTFNYKLKQKIPIPNNYDQMFVIIEHFFHKIKREQL